MNNVLFFIEIEPLVMLGIEAHFRYRLTALSWNFWGKIQLGIALLLLYYLILATASHAFILIFLCAIWCVWFTFKLSATLSAIKLLIQVNKHLSCKQVEIKQAVFWNTWLQNYLPPTSSSDMLQEILVKTRINRFRAHQPKRRDSFRNYNNLQLTNFQDCCANTLCYTPRRVTDIDMTTDWFRFLIGYLWGIVVGHIFETTFDWWIVVSPDSFIVVNCDWLC